MIRILAEDKKPLRLIALGDEPEVEVQFHDRYGFVTAAALNRRQRLRQNAGLGQPEKSARFAFKWRANHVDSMHGCQVTRAEHGWSVHSESGVFFIEPLAPAALKLEPLPPVQRPLLPTLVLFAAILLPFALLPWMTTPEVDKKAAEESEAPVVLHATPPPVKKDATPAPDPQAKSRKVVSQQLGFLGLLGKKNYSKAVGGLPTPSQATSPGAGPGGTQGSGGELIAGMGRGLHQTTVGNTGVKGLGGLGTHGAGGGEGGYGDTAFGGSAGGRTLSAIPLAQDAKVDEGLDRSQIQATIMRYLSQVRACYEEGLKRTPSMIGQVTMAFEVGPQGQMDFAKVQRSSLNDRSVEDCIQMKMMNWKFPQPRGGKAVKVTYPFMLRPVTS